MGERRALVIGAPNDRFGRLTFLLDAVRELHRVVCDPELGACVPALSDGRDLLIGLEATRAAIASALGDAVRAAARDQATLFVYFCGHGHRDDPDFYLVASDTPGPGQVDSETALPLGQRIKELLRANATVDGLMVVMDACHSGGVVVDPVPGLLRVGMHSRIEFLAATRPEQVASRGCFSRSLTERLRIGSSSTPAPELRAYDEHHRLLEVAPEGCRDMAPVVHLSLNGTADAGLWLGRNRAADLRPSLIGTPSAHLVARLTRNWQQRNDALGRLIALLGAQGSPIGITGGAGAGKSALLASLGRRSAGDLIGLDALVVVRPGDTLPLLAQRLRDQLARTDGYASAVQRWRSATPVVSQEAAPEFVRLISGPLSYLNPVERVRIGIDAADQLDTVERRRVIDAASGLPGVTLLLAGRRIDEIPASTTVILPNTDPDGVERLLTALVDDEQVAQHIAALANGEWLLARVLAELWHAGHLPQLERKPVPDISAAFDAAIKAAEAAAPEAPIDDVLRVLAAAPTGAWLPLLVVSSVLDRSIGGGRPDEDREGTAVRIRDAVVSLGELLARAEAGQATERIGPAHDLIAAHLRERYGDVAVTATHAALAAILRKPPSEDTPTHVRAYTEARLSEHLAAAGRTSDALSRLPELSTPADTLALWQGWHERLRSLGRGHPDVLRTRGEIAKWTGESGDAATALRMYEELLPQQIQVLGSNHPDVLRTRGEIAKWTGEAGKPAAALRLCEDLLPDRVRVLGPDHPDALRTRAEIARWTGTAGKPATALNLYENLLDDRTRVLGPDHPDVLATRSSVAFWTGRVHGGPHALRLFEKLLSDRTGILGPDHRDVLRTRSNVAFWTGRVRAPAEARRLFEQLLLDRIRVLGPEHPAVLKTRANIATWTGEAGDGGKALKLFRELLPDRIRVLGADHPDVLITRASIALWTGKEEGAAAALRLFQELLPDQAQVLGDDHPDVHRTRASIATWTREAGDAPAALHLLQDVMSDLERLLAPDHPDVQAARRNIALWSG